jgi:hypothetical protein
VPEARKRAARMVVPQARNRAVRAARYRMVVPEVRYRAGREALGVRGCPLDQQSLAAGKPQREAMRPFGPAAAA